MPVISGFPAWWIGLTLGCTGHSVSRRLKGTPEGRRGDGEEARRDGREGFRGCGRCHRDQHRRSWMGRLRSGPGPGYRSFPGRDRHRPSCGCLGSFLDRASQHDARRRWLSPGVQEFGRIGCRDGCKAIFSVQPKKRYHSSLSFSALRVPVVRALPCHSSKMVARWNSHLSRRFPFNSPADRQMAESTRRSRGASGEWYSGCCPKASTFEKTRVGQGWQKCRARWPQGEEEEACSGRGYRRRQARSSYQEVERVEGPVEGACRDRSGWSSRRSRFSQFPSRSGLITCSGRVGDRCIVSSEWSSRSPFEDEEASDACRNQGASSVGGGFKRFYFEGLSEPAGWKGPRQVKKGQSKKQKKKEKKRRKSKKKKRKRDPGGSDDGEGDGDSSPSPSSSGVTDSCDEFSDDLGSSSNSSDDELEAPLKKKSKKNPGSVLELLVSHAREQLDQSASVGVGKDEGHYLTSGIKVMTYFQVLLKPRLGGSAALQREMHHLATAIDLLRQGRLGLLGDTLAARFLCLHQSILDGNWSAAKHLEIFPMEEGSATSAGLLLRTRKHARLAAKAQGQDGGPGYWIPYGRNPKGKGKQEWSGGDFREQKGKGKKGGKGRGKNKQGNWYQGGDKHADQEWKENKEGKPDKWLMREVYPLWTWLLEQSGTILQIDF